MKISKSIMFASAIGMGLMAASCQNEVEEPSIFDVPAPVLDRIAELGFSTDNVTRFEDGFLVEGDIYLTEAAMADMAPARAIMDEQYRTTNLVSTNGNRVITMYAEEGGRKGYSAAMIAGLDEAITRYNSENLEISFSRISNQNQADIVMTRLRKGDERRGVLGSAGFPTASGDPYGEIKMSGILESAYGLSVDGIATIIAHEMGHCIGFRHTDFFDRSISCGGSPSNEGSAGVGAIHIPGTPTGASLSDQSFMLSCTDGSNREFNNDDVTALNYLY